jgi:hypothetical protein
MPPDVAPMQVRGAAIGQDQDRAPGIEKADHVAPGCCGAPMSAKTASILPSSLPIDLFLSVTESRE